MSEPKRVSPLLDGFQLGDSISEHNGIICYPAIREDSDEKYIVKVISVPASQKQLDAMLLAGAYKDPEGAMNYFKSVSEDILKEAQFLKDLSRIEGFLSYEGWQLEPITRHRLGYEVYLLSLYRRSLEKHVRKEPVTHREAMNLTLDLCHALNECRKAGALYVDLKPGNIFVAEDKEYRIGDLGFIRLDALKYTALPEKYHSCYTPPELLDPMASVNLTVDTYAVGMILYQLYNEGKLPPDTGEEEQVPAPVNADYELSEIILKAIHSDWQQRWQDPEQMGHAIVAYMQRNEITDEPITPYTPIDPEAQNVLLPQEEPAQDEQDNFEILSESEEPALPDAETTVPPEEEPVSPELETDIPVEEVSETEEAPEVFDAPEYETEEESYAYVEPISEPDMDTTAPEAVEPSHIPDEFSRFLARADDLIAHETPMGVVLPDIPEEPDPFAFATEDSIEAEDLRTPFDPVMDMEETGSRGRKSSTKKKFRSDKTKKKAKRLLGNLLSLALVTAVIAAGFWCYQNIYLKTIDRINVIGGKDQVSVEIHTNADESLLKVSCSDSYGNITNASVKNGKADFTGLLPNTTYTIQVEIDGFHSLVGQTSEMFTTETTTNILAFSAVTGPEDGSAILNFTVDGDEPETWNVIFATANEEQKTASFQGHTATVTGLSLGKEYVFTLDGGKDISLSGKTSLTFLSSRMILAENLTVATTDGTDMTIRWEAPGDTVIESWNVRCYNEAGFDETFSVTDTEVHLANIDSSVGYTVEVTAYGMTQPARSSITANPIRITNLNVDDTSSDKIKLNWEYAGTTPEDGWLLLYSIDGNTDLNVVKCSTASAEISPKLPDTDYNFTVQSVDGISIFNNVHSHTTPAAPDYNANGVTAADITASLLKTPEKSNWSYDNIDSDLITDTFSLGDPISVILHAKPDFYLPGTKMHVMYVIQDAYGNVIPDYVFETEEIWRTIWQSGSYHYGEMDMPQVPDAPGSYQMQIYFDGAFVAQTSFTIQ